MASVDKEYIINDKNMLPFYPKELKIKEIISKEKILQEEKNINKNLENIYFKEFIKQPKDYNHILDNMLSTKKSLGCKMLKKCVNLWWKANDKEKKSTQKGSHIKISGDGENIILVKPHGQKASSGIKANQVKKLLL